ncbi:MAG: SPFH domain-containing protein [candidate division Zixibacteria bacterium]|nr:SPFH domain-containing protein [candidate division Zixibacteria bacterium]MDH3935790.1 SPFH domain-containing protein [candidate division Zixibacteria bacterium]MDH4035553.1 SPFH domain-containing protein [candidate division Zixibacteria bacterium]
MTDINQENADSFEPTEIPVQKKSTMFKIAAIGGAVLLVLILILGDKLVENNDAPFIKIKQALDGTLTVRTEPGIFWQGFGDITKYSKSEIIWFSRELHEGLTRDQSIQVRYRDGGNAYISGSIRYVLPYDQSNAQDLMVGLHKAYRNQDNFVDRAIQRLLFETIQQSAGFFTSEESYTTHKSTYANYVRDQIMNGVYEVAQVTDTTIRPGGELKILPRNIIRRDENGEMMRKANPLAKYGVSITNVTIYDPIYEEDIQSQIAQRLNSKMQVIVARSEASLRTQEQITMKAQGERDVEIERYTQLVINMREELEAEQDKSVQTILSQMRAEAAEVNKRAQEWNGKAEKERGRGMATSKRLLQAADKNLDIKMQAVMVKHKAIADALAAGKNILPEIIFSEGSGGGNTLIEAMGINALQEMSDRQKTKASGGGK